MDKVKKIKVGKYNVFIEKAGQYYRISTDALYLKLANGYKWASGSRWISYDYYFSQRNTYKPVKPSKIKVYVKW